VSIIKSSDLASSVSVRPLAAARKAIAPRRAEPFVDPELLALRREVEALRRDLAQRDEAIAGHKAALDLARHEGEAEGRKAGRLEADDGLVERTAKLQQSLERALQRYGEEIASLERLAPLLACAGLEKVVGNPASQAGLLGQVIRRRIETLDSQAVVRIEVSPGDFPDPEALTMLAQATGRPGLEVLACDDLPAGGCRIKLRLGALEVGVGQQWDRLRETLEGLSEPEAAP
jgi:type III secretion protein L